MIVGESLSLRRKDLRMYFETVELLVDMLKVLRKYFCSRESLRMTIKLS